MNRKQRYRHNLLQCLLLTREDPAKIRRSETVFTIVSLIAMLVLLAGPIFYFRELGYEKYILAGCAATAGIVAMVWQSYSEGNRRLKELHEFIDFDRLKTALERETE